MIIPTTESKDFGKRAIREGEIFRALKAKLTKVTKSITQLYIYI